MKLNSDFYKRTVADMCLLLSVSDTHRKGVFTLNETAELIYDLLNEGKTREEILTVLKSTYDSDPAEISDYLDSFLNELRQHDILLDD